MLMEYYNEICEPYEYEKENATTGGIEIVRKLSDCVGGSAEKSLIRLVKLFISTGSGKGENGEEVVDEDEDVPNNEGEVESIVSEGEPEDACELLNSELQAQQQ
jgi:hypothetical protein